MSATIKQGMDFDEWVDAWHNLCRERGHVLKTYDDDTRVDQFVTSGGYCNGPGCVNCGWSACMHCDFEGKDIPACTAVAPHDEARGDGQSG